MEIVKTQLAMVAGRQGEPYSLLHSDVSRAYFNATVKRDVHVMLPFLGRLLLSGKLLLVNGLLLLMWLILIDKPRRFNKLLLI